MKSIILSLLLSALSLTAQHAQYMYAGELRFASAPVGHITNTFVTNLTSVTYWSMGSPGYGMKVLCGSKDIKVTELGVYLGTGNFEPQRIGIRGADCTLLTFATATNFTDNALNWAVLTNVFTMTNGATYFITEESYYPTVAKWDTICETRPDAGILDSIYAGCELYGYGTNHNHGMNFKYYIP